jgi:protein phosphatase PTC7
MRSACSLERIETPRLLGNAKCSGRSQVSDLALTKSAEIKAEEESAKQVNVFNAGVFLNPHFEKRHKGGEDAATLSSNLIAVADGVGGWAANGVDPANYARRLCKLIGEQQLDDHMLMNPKDVIVQACDQNKEVGSSTCVVATLDRFAPFMYTANLGDSGYLLLRKNGLDLVSIFRSREQTHSFNFPF